MKNRDRVDGPFQPGTSAKRNRITKDAQLTHDRQEAAQETLQEIARYVMVLVHDVTEVKNFRNYP